MSTYLYSQRWHLTRIWAGTHNRQIQYAAYPNVNNACGRGEQFGVQVVGALVIICWTVATAGLTFIAINLVIGLRVDVDVEEEGLDRSEHGGPADDYDEEDDCPDAAGSRLEIERGQDMLTRVHKY